MNLLLVNNRLLSPVSVAFMDVGVWVVAHLPYTTYRLPAPPPHYPYSHYLFLPTTTHPAFIRPHTPTCHPHLPHLHTHIYPRTHPRKFCLHRPFCLPTYHTAARTACTCTHAHAHRVHFMPQAGHCLGSPMPLFMPACALTWRVNAGHDARDGAIYLHPARTFLRVTVAISLPPHRHLSLPPPALPRTPCAARQPPFTTGYLLDARHTSPGCLLHMAF